MKRILNLLLFGFFVLAIMSVFLNAENKEIEKQKKEILKVLKKFQAGYTARDVSKIDEYARELFDLKDILIIGVASYTPGDMEWFEGINGTKKILELDWKGWGDLKMKLAEARIRVDGNTAWVAVPATSESLKEKKEVYDQVLKVITDTIELNKKDKKEGISREVLFWVSQYALSMLWNYEPESNEFIYPLRITAVLVKKKGKWLFRQMTFAFPTRSIPDVRILEEE